MDLSIRLGANHERRAVKTVALVAVGFLILVGGCPWCHLPSTQDGELLTEIKMVRSGGISGFLDEITVHPDGRVESSGDLFSSGDGTLSEVQLAELVELLDSWRCLDDPRVSPTECCDQFQFRVTYAGRTIDWTDLTPNVPQGVLDVTVWLEDLANVLRPPDVLDLSDFETFEFVRSYAICRPAAEDLLSATIVALDDGGFQYEPTVIDGLSEATLQPRILTEQEVERMRGVFAQVTAGRGVDCSDIIFDPCVVNYFRWDEFDRSDFTCDHEAIESEPLVEFLEELTSVSRR